MKKLLKWIATVVIVALCAAGLFMANSGGVNVQASEDKSQLCVNCHTAKGMGIAQIEEWKQSKHGQLGIGCYECHQAEAGDADAMEHYGNTVAILVTPRDCARCHEAEVKEYEASHHAKGGEILGSLDNVLGEMVEGVAAAASGCKQCHGGTVKVLEGGKLDPMTWPNTGIGRINPDGSRGSCTACHSRHAFQAKLARQPENCGKCHMGPDHPQIEIYNESKHGIAYRANIDRMNLDSDSWVLGKDYTAAPTCATCHMSATPELPLTHDVGSRISWTLRPPVSNKLENWEQRRTTMQKVCQNCHSNTYVKNFYTQYDAAVNLYNDKFAIPATNIMKKLQEAGKLTPTPFDETIEWTYYLLWHHEGRRARHGASMMGPDYTQWHGFFEVAERFYEEFVPQAEELMPGITDDTLKEDQHRWKKGMSKEERDRIKKFYEERYGQ
ncbi:MAG: multiheme c-type cytochrome [bacterium]